jgi:hypothetical protein
MKVRIVKNWSEPDLLRQTPGGAGRWNDFEFVIGPGAEPADFVVALNNRFDTDVAVACPSDRLLTLMQEPFVPGFTDWMDMDLEVYSKVLSSHRPRSGVAFDRWGNRLGYGAGFYDRLFLRLLPSALRVACVHDALLVDRVPAEPHDVPVDLLITESMALVCQC